MNVHPVLLPATLSIGAAQSQNLDCDLHEYKPIEGVTAESAAGQLSVTWRGDRAQPLRAVFRIRDGQPLVHELAARTASGQWSILARDVTPEFEVTTGRRPVPNGSKTRTSL